MTTRSLDECALEFLCGLTGPVRAAIKQAILTQIRAIEAEIANLTAQLAALEAQLLPAEALLQSATGILEAARANAIFALFEDAINCAAIGDLNESLSDKIQRAITEATDFIQDLRRKISAAAFIQDQIDRLNDEIDKLNQYLDDIDICDNRVPGEFG